MIIPDSLKLIHTFEFDLRIGLCCMMRECVERLDLISDILDYNTIRCLFFLPFLSLPVQWLSIPFVFTNPAVASPSVTTDAWVGSIDSKYMWLWIDSFLLLVSFKLATCIEYK